jgi:hypothetical protein
MSDSLVSTLQELFKAQSRDSRITLGVSLVTMMTAPFAIWAGGSMLSLASQPAFIYWNGPSAITVLLITTYLLGFAALWTVISILQLRVAYKWRTKDKRLAEAYKSLLHEVKDQ